MSSRYSRREVLAATTASFIGLTGCNQLQSSNRRSGTTIISAHISSRTPEPRTVSVLFERDTEVVYWRQFSVSAYDPENDELGGASVPVDSLTEKPSVWIVRAFNHHTGKFTSVTLGREVDPEIRVQVSIAEDDALTILNST